MERDEIVEYKERIEEDDDEYDEVGKIVFIDVTGNHSDLEIKVPKCISLMHLICVMKQNIPINSRSLMKQVSVTKQKFVTKNFQFIVTFSQRR